MRKINIFIDISDIIYYNIRSESTSDKRKRMTRIFRGCVVGTVMVLLLLLYVIPDVYGAEFGKLKKSGKNYQ